MTRTRGRARSVAWAVFGFTVVAGFLGSVSGHAASAPSTDASTDASTHGSTHAVAVRHTRSTTRTGSRRHPHRPVRRSPHAPGVVVSAAGAVLPNAARTPGATNPAVTQATIDRTICVSGWTATIRPSSSVTTRLKESQLATGYAFHGDTSTRDYEEDHLISLELGGAPRDPANLWPEPYGSREGAHVKDRVENRLRSLVCSRTISLATAQHAIATDWWAAYQRYGGSGYVSSSHPSVRHTSAPAPAPAPTASGNGATARCVDGTSSYAAHHQGACSHHGGVATFYR